MLDKLRFTTLLTWLFIVSATGYAGEADKPQMLIGTDTLSISVEDFNTYEQILLLKDPERRSSLSPKRASQAIMELYALALLDQEALTAGFWDDDEYAGRYADYLLTMERVTAYIDRQVSEAMLTVDLEASALEHYQANKSDYMTEATVTVRTLLISTDERSLYEAIDLTRELVRDEMTQKEFQGVVMSATDDAASKTKKGKMTIRPGETVPPFEYAAFALETPGQLSGPVVSVFGVHSIQLLERTEPAHIPFETVRPQILKELDAEIRAEIRQGIVMEAREREPSGFYMDQALIDEMMRARGYEDSRFTQ